MPLDWFGTERFGGSNHLAPTLVVNGLKGVPVTHFC